MNVLEAIFLGILQGATEFLPISSTAHLTIAAKFLGLVDYRRPEAWTAFMAIIQLGTMTAVLMYFWDDLSGTGMSLLRDVRSRGNGHGFRGYSHQSRMAVYMLIGTIPVAIVGFFFRRIIEGVLTKSTLVIACSMIGLALVLWFAEKKAKHTRTIGEVTWVDALLVGCAQALALIPGSSRSGTTITAALLLGFSRDTAARFSFLLSIPAVLASGAYEMYKVYGMIETSIHVFHLGITNLVVTTVVSAVAGYAAIAWLLRYLMKNTAMVFVWYRIALGTTLLLLLAGGFLSN